VNRVHILFGQLLFREDVVALLRKEPNLKEAERDFAIQVAQTHREETPEEWNDAAWRVVKFPGRGKEAHALALHQAETAVRLTPGDGFMLRTFGVALYRTGRYAEAQTTLTISRMLNARKASSLHADFAFLAMAQHQLGRKDEAKATLTRLREAMKQRPWANDAEAQGFLQEAEETLNEKPASEKK
jgi:Tfp pilus assembly protein PilF